MIGTINNKQNASFLIYSDISRIAQIFFYPIALCFLFSNKFAHFPYSLKDGLLI